MLPKQALCILPRLVVKKISIWPPCTSGKKRWARKKNMEAFLSVAAFRVSENLWAERPCYIRIPASKQHVQLLSVNCPLMWETFRGSVRPALFLPSKSSDLASRCFPLTAVWDQTLTSLKARSELKTLIKEQNASAHSQFQFHKLNKSTVNNKNRVISDPWLCVSLLGGSAPSACCMAGGGPVFSATQKPLIEQCREAKACGSASTCGKPSDNVPGYS